jgi:carbon-monoxide dehydrogenase large subunit
MVHAAFLRSPHAHARLRRVDTGAARHQFGVLACITGEELRAHAAPVRAVSRMKGYTTTEWPALAIGKVRYAGEAIAAVVTDTRYAAEDAAERISVEYELLPVVASPRAAIGEGSALVHEDAGSNLLVSRTFAQGDVDAAFMGAAVVVRDTFRFRRHAGVALENRACLAEWDAGAGSLTLWSSTQVPGLLREMLADVLGLPAHRLRVVAPDVGGGFGVKAALYPEEIVVCTLARLLGRPVKWVGDRTEDLLTSTQAWDEEIEAELAVDGDGTIRGLRARVLADIGAYSIFPWTASIEVIQVISFLPGPYRVPHYRGEGRGVATNKAPMGPYRGVGRPISTFVTEALLDRAARRLAIDPLAIRLRNVIGSADFPYRSPSGVVWDSGSFAESLTSACDTVGYSLLRAEQRRAREEGRCLGIGVSAYVELTGVGSAIPASPGAEIATGTEGATVRVDPAGSVTAIFGLACHGQGHETAMAQVVAEELGATIEDVRVIHGDTAAGPIGSGTYASRSAVIGGGAAILAARAVRDKALQIAAHLLEAAAEDVELSAGRAAVRGAAHRSVSLRDIGRAAYAAGKRLPKDMEPGLEATRFYDPYFGTASNAAHVAVVEVDRETGTVKLLRYVVADDCGRIINPLIVEGQVIGGVAQGIGAALLEEVVYNESGQLLTGSLMDYLVPTVADVPAIEVVHLEHPSPTTLGGFKGVGEGGTLAPPAALANAVSDALGAEVNELPISPEAVVAAYARPPQSASAVSA